MTDRPKRRAIPMAIKRAVVERQNGLCACSSGHAVSAEKHAGTEFDHMPALRLRDINKDGTDYIPPQHSPDHIDARAKSCGCHAHKTHGQDRINIKKERRRERPPKPKRKWGGGKGFPPRGSRKLNWRKP